MHAFKAELRKIMSVRSTYVWLLATFAMSVLLVGFWIYGYKDVEHAGQNTDAMVKMMLNGIGISGVFMTFPLLLLVGHEYRYNTILYSLTSAKHRFSLFFSKLAVGLFLAVVWVALMAALSCGAFFVGQYFHHGATLPQVLPSLETILRSLAYVTGSIAFGFVIAAIVRSMIASIVIFLLMPSMVEQLLSLVLKDGARFLPFTALSNLLPSANTGNPATITNLITVTAYAVGFGIVAAVLFWRRDAN